MASRNQGVVSYFERSCSRFIVPKQNGKPESTIYECQAERGHVKMANQSARIFSGPLTGEMCDRLESPLQENEADILLDAFASFIEPWRDRVWLNYSAVVSNRITVDPGLYSPVRASSAWSITGWLLPIRPGPAYPLGWSGRGDGLDWIKNRGAYELRGLAESLDRAEMIQACDIAVVLGPCAAAVILHEVVGHTVEASHNNQFNSQGNIGFRIASEVLSLTDYPLAPGGPVSYEYDDENIRCMEPTSIVNNGVIVAQVHSSATANAAGLLPTANGRAASTWEIPIPRVSNLICESGPSSEEELIARVGQGLYVERLANGINDGERIKADIVLAERIENGARSGKLVTACRIHEEMGILLRAVEVANNPTFNSNAICGKAGQLLFNVGTYAPSIRLSELSVLV